MGNGLGQKNASNKKQERRRHRPRESRQDNGIHCQTNKKTETRQLNPPAGPSLLPYTQRCPFTLAGFWALASSSRRRGLRQAHSDHSGVHDCPKEHQRPREPAASTCSSPVVSRSVDGGAGAASQRNVKASRAGGEPGVCERPLFLNSPWFLAVTTVEVFIWCPPSCAF